MPDDTASTALDDLFVIVNDPQNNAMRLHLTTDLPESGSFSLGVGSAGNQEGKRDSAKLGRDTERS